MIDKFKILFLGRIVFDKPHGLLNDDIGGTAPRLERWKDFRNRRQGWRFRREVTFNPPYGETQERGAPSFAKVERFYMGCKATHAINQ